MISIQPEINVFDLASIWLEPIFLFIYNIIKISLEFVYTKKGYKYAGRDDGKWQSVTYIKTVELIKSESLKVLAF